MSHVSCCFPTPAAELNSPAFIFLFSRNAIRRIEQGQHLAKKRKRRHAFEFAHLGSVLLPSPCRCGAELNPRVPFSTLLLHAPRAWRLRCGRASPLGDALALHCLLRLPPTEVVIVGNVRMHEVCTCHNFAQRCERTPAVGREKRGGMVIVRDFQASGSSLAGVSLFSR